LTAEGRVLHAKVHDAGNETRRGVRVARGLELTSARLGLYGIADVVEFGTDGSVRPIEYKRGRPKRHQADEVQLCAQALCLEEMLNVSLSEGAIFYGRTRRRQAVPFDAALRAATEGAIQQLHDLVAGGVTPRARREPKCDRCSLLAVCMPNILQPRATARHYLERTVADLLASPDPPS
jgi:CRISPR-associated exonuclease Cas4